MTPEAGRVLGEWLARWPPHPPCCWLEHPWAARAPAAGAALAADIRKLCRSRGLTALVLPDERQLNRKSADRLLAFEAVTTFPVDWGGCLRDVGTHTD